MNEHELILKIKTMMDAAGLDKLKSGMGSVTDISKKAGLAMAGLGAGAVIGGIAAAGAGAYQVTSALNETNQAANNLQAQLGLTGEEAAALADVGRNVFANNWGDSIEEANAVLGQTKLLFGDLNNTELQNVTEQAFAIRDAFGVEIEGGLAAAQRMAGAFGISATEALDMLAGGMQMTGEEGNELALLFQEYSGHLAQLGFQGPDVMSAIASGMQAGAFEGDKVLDMFKEMNIKMTEGSDATRDALSRLGLDPGIVDSYREGSISGVEMFQTIQAAIQEYEGNIPADLLADTLGTPAEDLGAEVVRNLDLMGGSVDEFKGKAAEAGNALYNNIGSAFATLKRQAVDAFADLIGGDQFAGMKDKVIAGIGSITEAIVPAIAQLGPALDAVVAGFASAFGGGEGEGIEGIFASIATAIANIDFEAVAAGARSFGEAIGGALSWLIENKELVASWAVKIGALVGAFALLAPVITTIGGLVSILGTVGGAIGAVVGVLGGWGAIWGAVSGAVMTVVGVLGGPLTIAIGAVIGLFAAWKTDFLGLRTTTLEIIDGIQGKFQEAKDFLSGLNPFGGLFGGSSGGGGGQAVADETAGMFEQMKWAASDFSTAMVNNFQYARDDGMNVLTSGLSALGFSLDEFGVGAGEKIADFAATTERTLEDAGFAFGLLKESVGNALTGSQVVVGEWGDMLEGSMLAPFAPIIEGFETKLSELSGIISSGMESARDIVAGIQDAIRTKISEVWNAIPEDVREDLVLIAGAVSEKFGEVRDEIAAKLNEIAGNIRLQWDAFLRQISEKLDAILGTVTEAWTEVSTAVSDKLEEILGVLQERWDAAVSVVSERVDAILSVVRERWEALRSVVQEKIDAVLSVVRERWEAIRAVVAEKVEAVLSVVRERFEALRAVVQEKLEAALAVARTVWERIKAALIDPIVEAVRSIGEKLSGLAGTVREKLQDMVDAGLELGAELVNGIKRGIDNRLAALRNTFWDSIRGVLDWLKGLLGIASPSRVMMEIGDNMIVGLTIGIENASPAVIDALKDVTEDMLDIVKETAKAMLGLAGVSASDLGNPGGLLTPIHAFLIQLKNQFTTIDGVVEDLASLATDAVRDKLRTLKDSVSGLVSVTGDIAKLAAGWPEQMHDWTIHTGTVRHFLLTLRDFFIGPDGLKAEFGRLADVDLAVELKKVKDTILAAVGALGSLLKLEVPNELVGSLGAGGHVGTGSSVFGWTRAMVLQAIAMADQLVGWLDDAADSWRREVNPRTKVLTAAVSDATGGLAALLKLEPPNELVGSLGAGGLVGLGGTVFGWSRAMVLQAVAMAGQISGWLDDALSNWQGKVEPKAKIFKQKVDDSVGVLASLLKLPEGVEIGVTKQGGTFGSSKIGWTKSVVERLVSQAKELVTWVSAAIGNWQGEVNPQMKTLKQLIDDSVGLLASLITMPGKDLPGLTQGGSTSGMMGPVGWTRETVKRMVAEGKDLVRWVVDAIGTWQGEANPMLKVLTTLITDSVGLLKALADLSRVERVGAISQEVLDGLVTQIRMFAQSLSGLAGQIDEEVAKAVASLGPAAESMMSLNEMFEQLVMSPFFSASRRVGGAQSSAEFRNSRTLSVFKERIKAAIQDMVTTVVEAMQGLSIPADLATRFDPLKSAAESLKSSMDALRDITVPSNLREVLAAAALFAALGGVNPGSLSGPASAGTGGGAGGGSTVRIDQVLAETATIKAVSLEVKTNLDSREIAHDIVEVLQTDVAAQDRLIDVLDRRRAQRGGP